VSTVGTPLRVLIAEDSPDDVLLLLREIRRGGYDPDYIAVDSAAQFDQALADGEWQVILADYAMPAFTGLDALRRVRDRGLDTPFILISGTIGEELAVEALKQGANDFLMKGRLGRLLPMIRRALNEVEQRREIARVENSLRETYHEMEGLIAASPMAIVAVDREGRVTVWNESAEKLFGWTREEVLGQPPPFIGSGDELALHFLLCPTGPDQIPTFLEMQICTRADVNRRVDLELYSAPLIDSAGGFRGVISYISDVTERKILEKSLRQSQKMEAIGQLAGGVAHDFNNLLQAIIGYTQVAMETLPPDAPVRADLQQSINAGQKAATLTRQLLAFSRRQILQPKDVDLNQLVGGFLRMLERVIGEHVTLQFRPAENLGTVSVDPGQIEQVIMNLVLNARDAMPDGGSILIQTSNADISSAYKTSHPWASEGPYVMLTVTDTGCGMDEATQSRIFEPFFSTKPEGEGTGLGLATVYGIIKQHGGFISLYSEPGHGTSFKIFLPLVNRSAAELGLREMGDVVGGNETILLAEDSETVRDLSVRILRGAGYRVLTACDGEEAVATFAAHADQIDLVLLDVIMPRLHGRAAFERISAIRPGVRVAFSTGYSTHGLHDHLIPDGDPHLIQKPYNPKDLLRFVRETLDAAPR